SISSLSNINLKDFDIVHIFNCIKVTDSYNYYMNAVNQKKRIALTPFFIDMHEHYGNNPEKLAERRVDNLLRREIMQGSHMLLLNSQKELSDIQRILYVDVPAKVIFHDWGNRKMEALMAKATFEAYQQVLDSNDSP